MIDLTIKLNNQETGENKTVRIINGRPVLSWEFDSFKVATTDEYGLITKTNIIEQHSFEILIGVSSDGLGTSTFVGNVKGTGIFQSTARSWSYVGTALDRGATYYGQIKVRDTENNFSSWKKFSFQFNALPKANSASLSPFRASITDDITLSYDFVDTDDDKESGTLVKWFKNGEHQRQFDNQTIISEQFLSYNDLWFAYVFPGDGFELGPRSITNTVAVSTAAPVSSNVQIFPQNPNENDILKADYKFTADIDDDKTNIYWYVNDVLQNDFNNQKFVRLDVAIDDKVRFEVEPFDGVASGDLVASKTVIIESSEFVVEDVQVEGRTNPLDVLSLRPVVSWSVSSPPSRAVKYISIRVGTFAGGDNVFSITMKSRQTTLPIPGGKLHRGTDYFVSVAVSDSTTFGKYAISHFRTTGSRWNQTVSNSTGWTIETVFNNDLGDFDKDNFQIIRIQDGTKFAEVRIFADRLGLFSSTLTIPTEDTYDFTQYTTLTITGKDSDVKVYVNRTIAIDGTGLLTQLSDDKRLEFGAFKTGLVTRYQSFYYSVDGDFTPGTSTEFNNIQFHEFASFPLSQALGLKGFVENNVNKKILAVNPHEDDRGGSVFSIVPGGKIAFGSAIRTFSPINNVCVSANDLYKVFSHARGASIFKSYLVSNYDHSIDFVETGSGGNPVSNNWELVQNIGANRISFTKDGLRINTAQS
tara:strand:+ start:8625 stop:10721 length:2097 start_codon:yes stop_codon:yes gene_type:complete